MKYNFFKNLIGSKVENFLPLLIRYNCPICGGEGTLRLKTGGWSSKHSPKLVYWCDTRRCATTMTHVGKKSDKMFSAFAKQAFKDNATRRQKIAAWVLGLS